MHTAGPLGSHGFAAPRAIVLHALRTFMPTHVLELGRPSVAGPVFARVFGPQTGVQKNHFFRSLQGAKQFGKPVRVENCWGESVWPV